jgi:putative FmdB family regulatory protein
MPIYEYKCENGHVFDVLQKMSDDPLAECIECGAPVRKILQPVGISFKGSGFYSTDYNKKGPKEEPKKAAATSGEPSTNGASDTKSSASEKTSTEPAKKGD